MKKKSFNPEDYAKLQDWLDKQFKIKNLQNTLEDCGIFEDDVKELLNKPKQVTH